MKSVKNLIKELEEECNEIEQMIELRVETKSTEDAMTHNMSDPFSLEVYFDDADLNSFHGYDIGRLEAFREIIRELNTITNE